MTFHARREEAPIRCVVRVNRDFVQRTLFWLVCLLILANVLIKCKVILQMTEGRNVLIKCKVTLQMTEGHRIYKSFDVTHWCPVCLFRSSSPEYLCTEVL